MRKLIVLFILTAVYSAQAQIVVPADSIWEQYQGNHFALSYPSTWSIDTSGKMGTELFIFSPMENDEDQFSENINVIIQDLKGMNIDLQQYLEISEKQVNDILTDAQLIQSEIIKDGNSSYYSLRYTMRQGKLIMRVDSRCIIQDEKAYLFSFGALTEKYEQYEKTSTGILNSFHLFP